MQVPPLASNVIGLVGAILNTPGCCKALAVGVKAKVKVIAAGLLFIIGIYFLTTLPTSLGPRLTILSFGSTTSICYKKKIQLNSMDCQSFSYNALRIMNVIGLGMNDLRLC